jgi:hypothetical protein
MEEEEEEEEGLACWLIGGAVVVVVLLLQVQTSFNIFGWMRFFLGSVFFFLNEFFSCRLSHPSHGKRYKKMAIIITISREHLAKSG